MRRNLLPASSGAEAAVPAELCSLHLASAEQACATLQPYTFVAQLAAAAPCSFKADAALNLGVQGKCHDGCFSAHESQRHITQLAGRSKPATSQPPRTALLGNPPLPLQASLCPAPRTCWV